MLGKAEASSGCEMIGPVLPSLRGITVPTQLEGPGWAGRGAGPGTWPGAASRARDPPRAEEGPGWGGAANLGGQRDRPAVERLTGCRAALGPGQSWLCAWTRLRQRGEQGAPGCGAGRSPHAGGSALDLGRAGLLGGRTGGPRCCLHPTWEMICTPSPACSGRWHCTVRTLCCLRAERTLAGPI